MQIFLPSFAAASGVCWLVNCLLELGVMCFIEHQDDMWHRKNVEENTNAFPRDKNHRNDWALKPAGYWLQAHLPIFARKKEFSFIPGITAQWDHVYPKDRDQYDKVILFVRDPRDSLYSIYRRGSYQDWSYTEFCEMAQPIDCHGRSYNYLPRLDDWVLFHLIWLERKDIHITRFEDYKKDAVTTLQAALDYLGLHFSDMQIKLAVERSSHEKAREAEDRYYADNPGIPFNHRVNRASKINDYLSHADAAAMADRIYTASAGLLNRMGYSFDEAPPPPAIEDFLHRLHRNDWFASLPASIKEKAQSVAASHWKARRTPIYLFGCGHLGQTYARDFVHFHFNGFIDNNSENWGKTIAGLSVFGPQGIAKLHPDALALITAANPGVRLEMQAQCHELGLDCSLFLEFLVHETGK